MQDKSQGARLRAMTLNMWGVPCAPDRVNRMSRLVAWLQDRCHVDIIAIQEIFVDWDVHRVVQAARRGGLAHHHYFRAGPGFVHSRAPGMLVLARHPIREAHYHRYAVNGKPHKIHHIDWWFAKGVGLVRVDAGSGIGEIDIFVTHLVSCYVPWGTAFPEDEYGAQRAAQAWECARWIRLVRRAPLVLLLCDMNADAHSLPHSVVCHVAGLRPLPGMLDRPTFDGSEGEAQVDHVLWDATAWKPAGACHQWCGATRISDHVAVVGIFVLSRGVVVGAGAGAGTPGPLPTSTQDRLRRVLRLGLADAESRQRRHAARAAGWVLLAWLLRGALARWCVGGPCLLWTLAGLELVLAVCFCADEKSGVSELLQVLGVHRAGEPARRRPWMEWACARVGGSVE